MPELRGTDRRGQVGVPQDAGKIWSELRTFTSLKQCTQLPRAVLSHAIAYIKKAARAPCGKLAKVGAAA